MKPLKHNSQDIELRYLLDEISQYNLQETGIYEDIPAPAELSQNEFLQILKDIQKNKKEYIIADARSENEFEENPIPYSINLPVLNNEERHKVGLLYAKHSPETALSLACYYAKKKEKNYVSEAGNYSKDKKIIVYCWRGGERSRFAAGLLRKNNIPAVRLLGGQKAFRRIIYDTLYQKPIPLISLSGITGCGKSEILEYIEEFFPGFPVLHLERCAGHASSVFGEIPYSLRKETKRNQQQFETNIFMELLPYMDQNGGLPTLLSENESKKIGGLTIPPAIQKSLEDEKHILITGSMEQRIERLAGEYFRYKSNDENLKHTAKEKVKDQLHFLSKKLSMDKIRQYREWIDKDQYSDFLGNILETYYDKIYKNPVNEPLITIENNRTDSTAESIISYWKENNF